MKFMKIILILLYSKVARNEEALDGQSFMCENFNIDQIRSPEVFLNVYKDKNDDQQYFFKDFYYGPRYKRNDTIKLSMETCDPYPITTSWKYNPFSDRKNLVSEMKIVRRNNYGIDNDFMWYCINLKMEIKAIDLLQRNITILIQRVSPVPLSCPSPATLVSFKLANNFKRFKRYFEINSSIQYDQPTMRESNDGWNEIGRSVDCKFNFVVQKLGNSLLVKCDSNIVEKNFTKLMLFFPYPIFPYVDAYFKHEIQERNCIRKLSDEERCMDCSEFDVTNKEVVILHCSVGSYNTSRRIVFPFVDSYKSQSEHSNSTKQFYTSWEEIDPHKMMEIEANPKISYHINSNLKIKCHYSNYYFAHYDVGEDDPTISVSYLVGEKNITHQGQGRKEITSDKNGTTFTFTTKVSEEIQKAKQFTATCNAPVWNSNQFVSISRKFFLPNNKIENDGLSITGILWATLLGITGTCGVLLLILILVLIRKNAELNRRIEVHRNTIQRRRDSNNQRSSNMYAEAPNTA